MTSRERKYHRHLALKKRIVSVPMGAYTVHYLPMSSLCDNRPGYNSADCLVANGIEAEPVNVDGIFFFKLTDKNTAHEQPTRTPI